MSAGQMREQVTIQQQTWTNGIASWSDFATVSAQVEPWATQRDETIAGAEPTSENRYRVTVWYRGDVTPKMRVLWTPYLGTVRTLDIGAVSPQSNRVTLRLDCVEAPA